MKKVLALIMVLAMMLSLSVMAFADDPDPKAETDTAFAQNQGQTQFKMTITDAKTGEPEYTEVNIGADASGNYYKVNTTVKSSQNVSVTVPLYVTMVATQSGAVSTPSNYEMKNKSTYTRSTEVDSIEKYWKTMTAAEVFAAIKAGDDDAKDWTDYSQLTTKTSTYANKSYSELATWLVQANYVYYIDSTNTLQQVPESACKSFDGTEGNYFKDATNPTSYLRADGKTVETGKTLPDEKPVTEGALKVAVSALKVQQQGSWKLVDTTPSALGEINISINNQNLYPAVNNTYDISGSGWTIDGGTTGGKLALPISAAIAANNTQATEAAVMTVTYTITPGAIA